MKQQPPPEVTRLMEYQSSSWRSSICKPPRYCPPAVTFYKRSAREANQSVYASNATESTYIWNLSKDCLKKVFNSNL